LLRGEQSNTSLRFGDALILKLFRRVQFGPNPEVEIGRFLTERTQFRGTPAVVGSLDYQSPAGQTASLALLQTFQPNRGDAWKTTLERLRDVLQGADAQPSVQALARLGATTGALHVALAQPGGGPDFDPERIDEHDVAAWRGAMHADIEQVVQALSKRSIPIDAQLLMRRVDGIQALRGALKTRHHGDYHLGQVLETPEGEFVVIDFEGEPSKPLAVRREKRSPLRDVAGMLRSFDYARHAALRAGDADDAQRRQRATAWYDAVRPAFLGAYLDAVRSSAPELLPAEVEPALRALETEKAAYEVLYELNNRPDWLPIPLAALA
jgi:trehalose synthase-fused probable maltokinase